MYKKLLEEIIAQFNVNSELKVRMEIVEADSIVDEAKGVKYKLHLIHERKDNLSFTMIYSLKNLRTQLPYKNIVKEYTSGSFWRYSEM